MQYSRFLKIKQLNPKTKQIEIKSVEEKLSGIEFVYAAEIAKRDPVFFKSVLDIALKKKLRKGDFEPLVIYVTAFGGQRAVSYLESNGRSFLPSMRGIALSKRKAADSSINMIKAALTRVLEKAQAHV